MGLILIFGVMIVYAVGVLTGIYVGYSIKKELGPVKKHKTTPSVKDSKKILALARKKQRVTNNDIEKLIGVSDATATRYLDTLEERGDLVQHGTTGRDVYYTVV